jgi:hypothetical protein
MMTVPPQLTSSLPSFSYPASFRHPAPASSKILSSRPFYDELVRFLGGLGMKDPNQDLVEVLVERSCGDPGELLQEALAYRS